jgi:hypothetical protein
MPKAGKFFEKKSSSYNLLFKNASKYPDILSEFLKLILKKSDLL